MIDTKAIRNKILQLAIEGKLVPQNPAEGTGQALLDQIRKERKADKKLKSLAPVTPEDQPFVIPDTWCWCRLGETLNIARGGSPRPIKQYITDKTDGINWIKIGDTDKGGKYINSTNEKIISEGIKHSRFVHKGDFLLSNSMSFGRPYILNIDGCIHDGWLVLSEVEKVFFVDYLYYLLSSNVVYNQFQNAVSGAVVNNLNSDKVAMTVVPLPPLAEQKRIVAKIEEIFALLDTIDKAQQAYTADGRALHTKLLQLAIEGKLVPQDPAEGTGQALLDQIRKERKADKKAKPLAPVTPVDQPFVIPDTWCWCRLGETSVKIFAGGDKPEVFSENKTQKCFVPVIANGEINEGVIGYTNEATVKEVSLTVSGRGTIGFSCVRREPFCPIVRLLVLIPSKYVDIDFLKLVLSVLIEKGNGTSVKQLTVPMIVPKILPLPPLAEQKRIVAKLEELLPLCEEME